MSLAKPIKHLNVGYPDKFGDAFISSQAGKRINVFSARLVNESGSQIAGAIMRSFSKYLRDFFSYDGAILTDQTALLNAGGPVDIFSGNGSGFAIQSIEEFQAILFSDGSTGSTGGSFAANYWNGTSFVPVLQYIETPVNFTANSNQMLYFSAGYDWVPGGNLAGLDPNKFTILFTATGQSGSSNAVEILPLEAIQYAPAIPNGSSFEASFDSNYPLQLGGDEQMYAYFSVAGNNNKVISFYSKEE